MMDRRRLEMERVERRSSESVWDMFPERRGNTRLSVAMAISYRKVESGPRK